MAQLPSPPLFPTTNISSEMRKKQKQEDEQAAASLPEGPLIEILSRVPYKSLCRFKCVSKPWFDLCSDHEVRKRCPQTLSGFFHSGIEGLQFRNLSGRGPPMVDTSLPFLRKIYEIVYLEHCCGGLILCRCWKSGLSGEADYYLVVCNPATEKWTELPISPIEFLEDAEHYLGFDPADPSRFMVFTLLWGFEEVAIYSSITGRWTTVQSGCVYGISTVGPAECVFLNGYMHWMTTDPSIAIVDTEGEVWRDIEIPGNVPENYADSSIGQSQGCLYAWYIDNVCQLSVWALEDYASAKWTLKHTVNVLQLFGRHCRKRDESYTTIAIHPDRNLIFLTDRKEKTISYDMDNREVHLIDTSKKFWGHDQPYIPCFAEWPSDGH